ncbi:hypothetical protein AMTR_s00046p00212340 [Amborella trichopoda]|uniref:Uncharacterized protein n=1 Tax=Amborella trichopoda TaxID=13333 RepID=U5D770_AMBTC|nr:hypothetical protein AMTR_s00046p00212340 [Amborella trichopoda]
MWSILPSTLTILSISLESIGKKDFARVKSIKIIVDSPNISPREGEDPKGRGNKRGVGCRSPSSVTRLGVEGVGWVGQIQGRIRRVSLKLKHLGVQDIRGKGIAERLPRTGQALLCVLIVLTKKTKHVDDVASYTGGTSDLPSIYGLWQWLTVVGYMEASWSLISKSVEGMSWAGPDKLLLSTWDTRSVINTIHPSEQA